MTCNNIRVIYTHNKNKIMKKFLLSAALFAALQLSAQAEKVKVSLDLVNVTDDKVSVVVTAPKMTGNQAVFLIPKTVPGTYSADDYGRMIEDFKAYDKKGKPLTVKKEDVNTYVIQNAKNLAKVTYKVNDSFDEESKYDVFSPAGTNIDKDKNFVLNLHGFVGYFKDKTDLPIELVIDHPASLTGATALVDEDPSDVRDVFTTNRYFDLTDNPIMYSKPDMVSFMVDGMEILFAVYSPTGAHSAASLGPDMEKTMRAQKAFMGDINQNKKYAILLYLSEMDGKDANGFGALEHHNSTVVVFPEMMPKEALEKSLADVVAHEFFHTVTPLNIHSKEIHYFDYNSPQMSQHLWLYEGVTEYFANLFQVQQGLIDENAFYNRIQGKIDGAKRFNDTMPFTVMSKNVLEAPYKAQYLNVYEKGALIGMCIDIIIREKSNGEKGILDLMKKLSAMYGPEKPFDDNELFERITLETYPEVGEFLNVYVAGEAPIPYDAFFAKMGVGMAKRQVPVNPFLRNKSSQVTLKPGTRDIMVINASELNPFMTKLGLKAGDVIRAINGVEYNFDNIYDLIMGAQKWTENTDVTFKIERDGKPLTLKGKPVFEYDEVQGLGVVDKSKENLRLAWLKRN